MMFFRALALLLALGGSALAQSGQIPSATVWGNSGASKAIASPATLSAMFDRAFGSTGGSLIARSGAAWGLVSGTATARLPLLSGANTTPVWGAYTLPASVTSGGVSCFTSTSAAGSSVLLTASALVLGGGAGACPSPMASLGTTTTLLHGNAAGAPTFGAVVAADVTTNTLTNATLAQAAASTLKGNPTAGSANVQDFTITGLTVKATPAGADELLVSDSAASNVFKKATVTSLLSAGAVTSIAGNAGAFTLANGIDNSVNQIQLTAARRTLPTTQVFTTGTAATYTTPANCLWIEVEMVGGGGGGAGSGTTPGAAGDGTDTTFSTLTAAKGIKASTTAGGAGGTGTGGFVNKTGATGAAASGVTTANPGGAGANSPYGGGGAGGASGAGAGQAAQANTGSGGGGGGVNTTASGGGGGGAGGFVRAIINSPSGSYTYTVGASGTAGTAGTSGAAGGAGASGFIQVIEHYGS